MKRIRSLCIIVVFVFSSWAVHAVQTRVSGFVKDKVTGENLIRATVSEVGGLNRTFSDHNGYFSLIINVPSTVTISYVGYKSLNWDIKAGNDTLIDFFLEPSIALDVVEIIAAKPISFNVATLSPKELQAIPSLGGKPDVLKAVQMQPGIQSQNEGSSTLLVRGGSPGENLYLFDQVPIIYVNHLGGFMSVFNPDMINAISVYKGSFPAKYGGKLSSVVDITQREGDKTKLKGSLSIGLTDLSFAIEGPTKIKNTSFIVTGRKTLIDPFMALASKLSEGNDFTLSYGFHDINGKFSWRPNFKNNLHFNLYEGDDYVNYWSNNKDQFTKEKNHLTNIWGNLLTSVVWNHVASPRLFVSNHLSYTRYRLKDKQKFSIVDTSASINYKGEYKSLVHDVSLKSDWKYEWKKNWLLGFGWQSSFLTHLPNYSYRSNQAHNPSNKQIHAFENALYLDNKILFDNYVEMNVGGRLANYSTENFSKFTFEPRLNFTITLSEKHIVNASYTRTTQNSHLIFTSGNIMNNEVWIPAGAKISPAYSNQYAVGWKTSFLNHQFETEIGLYYKKMHHLATIKEGYTSLAYDDHWQSKIETDGSGESKGFEFLIRKNIGKWTGFASYTYSHTTRTFANINKGLPYLYEYDRPHCLSLNANWKMNDKWSFSLVWIYQTGLPYTPAVGRHYTVSLEPDENGNPFYYEALVYGERNCNRMRDYHRLDVGANYTKFTTRGNKAVWSFSVYNVYNRQNPYYYYYNSDNTGSIYDPGTAAPFQPLSLYQVSFFPIIPSVSYKVFFEGNASKKKESASQKIKKYLYHEN